MNELSSYAHHYYNVKVYSFPSSQRFYVADWKNEVLSERAYASFDWNNADHIYGVAGPKGVRAIVINTKGLTEADILLVAKAFIDLQHLDKYPWFIRYINSLYIILETENISASDYIPSYTIITIIWQGYFPLPCGKNYPAKFYNNQVPTIAPVHTDYLLLFDTLDSIDSFVTELKEGKDKEGSNTLIKDLGIYGSRSYYEKTKAKECGLTIEEFRAYEICCKKLLEKYKKKILLRNKRKNLLHTIKNIGEIILCVLTLIGINLLWIGPLISKSFKDFLEPFIFIAGIIMFLYIGMMIIAPFYLIAYGYSQGVTTSKWKRLLLSIVFTFILFSIFWFLLFIIFRGILHVI